MTKAELETQLENDSLGVVAIKLQEEGSLASGKTYKKYTANVLAKEGDSQNFVNIPFTVLDEGGANEEAFLTQGRKAPQLDAVRKAVANYIKAQSEVIRFIITEVNEDTRDARVSVVADNGDGTATEKTYLVYKNGNQAITHVALT